LLHSLLERFRAGRRRSGGWSVDLDPQRDRDPLATASAVRGLHAAGLAVEPVDLELVRADALAAGNVSPYVRCFCLLVLLEVAGHDASTAKIWNDLLNTLRSELHERTEANYEFTVGNRQYYVRVPWQLYAPVSAWLALLAALALAGFGLFAWVTQSKNRLDAVGPELAAAALLAIISFLLSRVRTRKR
jgi:hypothetical protein